MMLGRFCRACGGVVALVGLVSQVAWPASIPDSAAIERLVAARPSLNRFRISSTRGTFEMGALKTEGGGLRIEMAARRSSLQSKRLAAGEDPGLVRWQEIERIEGGHSDQALGTGVGVAIGGVVGLTMATVLFVTAEGGDYVNPNPAIALPIPIGLMLGGLIGHTVTRPARWQVVYPEAVGVPKD